MIQVTTIPALEDNFIYLVRYEPGKALVVDPADAALVGNELQQQDLILTTILVTHHHYDHIGGVSQLKHRWPCRVIAPDSRIPDLDILTEEQPRITLGKTTIDVIPTPGHTTSSVCYLITSSSAAAPLIFTGDTLFIGGCGRVVEGAYDAMYKSLRRIASLPDETILFPGHNYTEENYRFALTVRPRNTAIKTLLGDIPNAAEPPSTIAREKQTNIFLLAKGPAEFKKLRLKKDSF
jgi:hydroxyacylglutathione hydrolase